MTNSDDDRCWYLYTADGNAGPYTKLEIQEYLSDGLITPEFHAWRAGMTEWLLLAAIPEFKSQIAFSESLSSKPSRGGHRSSSTGQGGDRRHGARLGSSGVIRPQAAEVSRSDTYFAYAFKSFMRWLISFFTVEEIYPRYRRHLFFGMSGAIAVFASSWLLMSGRFQALVSPELETRHVEIRIELQPSPSRALAAVSVERSSPLEPPTVVDIQGAQPSSDAVAEPTQDQQQTEQATHSPPTQGPASGANREAPTRSARSNRPAVPFAVRDDPTDGMRQTERTAPQSEMPPMDRHDAGAGADGNLLSKSSDAPSARPARSLSRLSGSTAELPELIGSTSTGTGTRPELEHGSLSNPNIPIAEGEMPAGAGVGRGAATSGEPSMSEEVVDHPSEAIATGAISQGARGIRGHRYVPRQFYNSERAGTLPGDIGFASPMTPGSGSGSGAPMGSSQGVSSSINAHTSDDAGGLLASHAANGRGEENRAPTTDQIITAGASSGTGASRMRGRMVRQLDRPPDIKFASAAGPVAASGSTPGNSAPGPSRQPMEEPYTWSSRSDHRQPDTLPVIVTTDMPGSPTVSNISRRRTKPTTAASLPLAPTIRLFTDPQPSITPISNRLSGVVGGSDSGNGGMIPMMAQKARQLTQGLLLPPDTGAPEVISIKINIGLDGTVDTITFLVPTPSNWREEIRRKMSEWKFGHMSAPITHTLRFRVQDRRLE